MFSNVQKAAIRYFTNLKRSEGPWSRFTGRTFPKEPYWKYSGRPGFPGKSLKRRLAADCRATGKPYYIRNGIKTTMRSQFDSGRPAHTLLFQLFHRSPGRAGEGAVTTAGQAGALGLGAGRAGE